MYNKWRQRVSVGVVLFIFNLIISSSLYAIIDAEAYFGYQMYSGKMIDDIPTSDPTVEGGVTDIGASAHLYLIPFIPIGLGGFVSITSLEKVKATIKKDDAEFFTFENEPTIYTAGGELAINAPLAILIDPYVRIGFGGLFGDAPTKITAPTNAVTEAAGFAGKSEEIKDMKVAGLLWHVLAGVKFKLGVPFFRIGVEAGYRSILGLAFVNANQDEVPTKLDLDKFTDIQKFPAAGIYQEVNGFFGRLGLIFDF